MLFRIYSEIEDHIYKALLEGSRGEAIVYKNLRRHEDDFMDTVETYYLITVGTTNVAFWLIGLFEENNISYQFDKEGNTLIRRELNDMRTKCKK